MNKEELEKRFIHLHVHNGFSLKDGLNTPQQRVDWAVKNEKNACSTSNHGNISDWLQIYNGCREAKIKPILGIEAYLKRGSDELNEILANDDTSDKAKAIRKKYRKNLNHITLFAKNITGYYNLIKLNNEAWIDRFYGKPICSENTIAKYHEGVVCLSGCANGEINRFITLKHHFQDEARAVEIEGFVKEKTKLMKSAIKSRDFDKLMDNEYADEFDLEYVKSHEKFDQTDYESLARNRFLEQDKAIIDSADDTIDELIKYWKNVFADDYYFEMMMLDLADQQIINQELIKLSKKYDIKLAITNDAHYLTKQESDIQKAQMLSDQKVTWAEMVAGKKEIWVIETPELYYKTVDELHQAWESWNKSDIFTEEVFYQAIENSISIVDKIEEYDLDTSVKMPKLWPNGKELITKYTIAGLKTKNINPKTLGEYYYNSEIRKITETKRLLTENERKKIQFDIMDKAKSDLATASPESKNKMIKIIGKTIKTAIRNAQDEIPYYTVQEAEKTLTDKNITREELGEKWYDIYKKQISYEFNIIFTKNYQDYFLMIHQILDWSKEQFGNWSVGPGRGSSAGSLVCYLMGITNVDPFKHDLMFERFLDPSRKDLPDVDCLHELTLLKIADGSMKLLKDIKQGDIVLDHFNNPQKVLNWTTRLAKEGYEQIVEIVVENNGKFGAFICPGHHRMINQNNETKFVYDLNIGDKIKSFNNESVIVQINNVVQNYNEIRLCDIQVENTKTFQIYPFKVDKNLTCQKNIFKKV
jgi:DNA polymerase III alpha subunit